MDEITPENPRIPPGWWTEWIQASEDRLPVGHNPFNIPTVISLASFALQSTPIDWEGAPLDQALGFTESLIKIMLNDPMIEFSIEFDSLESGNCTDLDSKKILLDPAVFTGQKGGPVLPRDRRLDTLGGIGLHEALHLLLSSQRWYLSAREPGQLFGWIHNAVDDTAIVFIAGTQK